MSDIYLELRSRIPVVAARTRIGSARIQEAQDSTGLSNEAIARQIPVSEKTWRRWKEAGEIPTASLPSVARVLGLELKGASPPPAVHQPAEQEIESLRAEIGDVREQLGRIETLVRQLAELPEQRARA